MSLYKVSIFELSILLIIEQSIFPTKHSKMSYAFSFSSNLSISILKCYMHLIWYIVVLIVAQKRVLETKQYMSALSHGVIYVLPISQFTNTRYPTHSNEHVYSSIVPNDRHCIISGKAPCLYYMTCLIFTSLLTRYISLPSCHNILCVIGVSRSARCGQHPCSSGG